MTAGSYSIPEVQWLLRTLASGRRAAEAGTALGGGAEAIASTARSLVTVEIDPERAAQAQRRLASLPHVTVVEGDWKDVLPEHGPFEFLFADGGPWKRNVAEEGPLLLELLAPGGILVVDDMTPGRPGPDPVRAFVLENDELAGCEILTTRHMSALIAVRR